MENISNKMAKGAAWMVAFKLVERSIGLVSTIILARLLEPGDFGLVAMATAFLGLLMLLTSFSFDVALIQKQDADRHLYDTAWTFNVIFGVLLALTLVGTAIPLARFYNETRLEDILYVFAISTFLGGFGNIGPVAFRKDLEFHKEFYFLLAKKLMGFVVCMFLAFTLRNYWALVWGTVAGRALEVILSYRVHPYRPRFCLRGSKELFRFSIWMFFNNTIFFTHNRVADFIISKISGAHSLGVYTIAYELSNLPTTELVAPINRAVLPGYSKMAHNLDTLRQGFLDVLSMIALCSIPIGIGIALIAEPMVEVILGEKWREAIPIIQILAISGMITALQTNVGTVFIALGKPRFITLIILVHTLFIFLPLLTILLQQHQIIGVAEAYLYSNLIMLPISYFLVARIIKLTLLSILRILWRPFLACWAMISCVIYTKEFLYLYHIDIKELRLIIEIATGAITYSFSIILLWFISLRPAGAEQFIFAKLKVYFKI
jgi:lipopolysaccharide exporter